MSAALRPAELPAISDIVADYASRVETARTIASFTLSLPLDDMARIATDAAHMALVRMEPVEAVQQMRRDRDTLEILRSAQRQLKQVELRYTR